MHDYVEILAPAEAQKHALRCVVYRFNVSASLQLVNRFLLMPGALSSAKYTREGELFARLKLEDVLSEDSMAGRLILQNAQIAWVAPAVDTSDGNKEMRKVGRADTQKHIFYVT